MAIEKGEPGHANLRGTAVCHQADIIKKTSPSALELNKKVRLYHYICSFQQLSNMVISLKLVFTASLLVCDRVCGLALSIALIAGYCCMTGSISPMSITTSWLLSEEIIALIGSLLALRRFVECLIFATFCCYLLLQQGRSGKEYACDD